MSEGRVDTTTSLGAVSYNWSSETWTYPFKEGTSKMDTFTMLMGASANLTDLFALRGGGINVDLVTEGPEIIGHSALVSDGINISVGPMPRDGYPFDFLHPSTLNALVKGRVWPNYLGTGKEMTVPIYNVNKDTLSYISANIAMLKDSLGNELQYSGITNSCVAHTGDALMRVGLNPFGSLSISPLGMHVGIVTRHLGITANPFQAVKKKDPKVKVDHVV